MKTELRRKEFTLIGQKLNQKRALPIRNRQCSFDYFPEATLFL